LTEDIMEPAQTEPGVWRQQWRAHSYEVDFRQWATLEAICRRFLDAAWNHAGHLGFGYEHLARQGLLWVLVRLVVRVERYPFWGEPTQLRTWPRGLGGAFALRDFEIVDSGGTQLAAGASSWLVLASATHRPQRIDKLSFCVPGEASRSAAGREPKKLPSFVTGESVLTTTARYSDIDVNEHVNSARYIGWLLDSYAPAFQRDHQVRSLEVNYVTETKWGDTVSVFTMARSGTEFGHWIIKSDQSEACRAELQWAAAPSLETH
jgi:medium-chain acyl-[acyl-carrier-protein] hydrolase